MVKKQKKDIRKSLASKHFNQGSGRARIISASTEVGTCGEALSSFGELLGVVKFLELFDFKKHFDEAYVAPSRGTKLGDCAMVLGIVMLMFIGFNRIAWKPYYAASSECPSFRQPAPIGAIWIVWESIRPNPY